LRDAEFHDCQLLLFVEMLARCVKNELRLLLRETMRAIKVPLEQPYTRLVIDHCNRMFGRSADSTLYWKTVLKQVAMRVIRVCADVSMLLQRLIETFSCDAGLSAEELSEHDDPNDNFDLKGYFVRLGQVRVCSAVCCDRINTILVCSERALTQ